MFHPRITKMGNIQHHKFPAYFINQHRYMFLQTLEISCIMNDICCSGWSKNFIHEACKFLKYLHLISFSKTYLRVKTFIGLDTKTHKRMQLAENWNEKKPKMFANVSFLLTWNVHRQSKQFEERVANSKSRKVYASARKGLFVADRARNRTHSYHHFNSLFV